MEKINITKPPENHQTFPGGSVLLYRLMRFLNLNPQFKIIQIQFNPLIQRL
jgi:hypothetical protein